MTDLHNRFRTLDSVQAPDLWREIEGRALAVEPRPARSLSWTLVVAMLLLTLAVAGAVLVGSGILKLPAVVDASASPSATADASADPSADASGTPVEPVPASWTATGSMSMDRADHTATLLLDGTLLVVGSVFLAGPPGCCAASPATELYDPDTGTWTATGNMIEGRLGHMATRLADGRVLVTGGGGDGVSPGLSAELYDPVTGTWTATGSMIEPFGIATLLLDGTVLLAGSGDGNSAQLYDPGSGTWSVTGNMIEARGWRTATLLLDGRVLVTDGGGSGSAELYHPATGTWTVTGSMIEARSWQSATLLPDGTVLVAGGMGSTGSGGDEVVFLMDSAELYDPDTGTWTATGSMIEARHDHRATVLVDGRVLVTGGPGVDSNEVYDPSSGTWTATASMIVARGNHTATLLSDGTVLVTGGYINTGSGGTTASAELYDPGSGT